MERNRILISENKWLELGDTSKFIRDSILDDLNIAFNRFGISDSFSSHIGKLKTLFDKYRCALDAEVCNSYPMNKLHLGQERKSITQIFYGPRVLPKIHLSAILRPRPRCLTDEQQLHLDNTIKVLKEFLNTISELHMFKRCINQDTKKLVLRIEKTIEKLTKV